MPEILKMRNYCMKKSPRTVQVRGELVPVAGIEPARGISPMDFESTSSTNSNTPAEDSFYRIAYLFGKCKKKFLGDREKTA